MNPYPQFDAPNPPPISNSEVSDEASDHLRLEVLKRLLDKFYTTWPKLYTVEDCPGSSFTTNPEADGTNGWYELGITPEKVRKDTKIHFYGAYLVFLERRDDETRKHFAEFRITAEIADSILSVLKVEGQQALIAWKHICGQGLLESYAQVGGTEISATGIFPDGHTWAVSYAPKDSKVKKPSHSYFLPPNYVCN